MGVVIPAPENKPLDAPNVGKIHLLKTVRFRIYALDEVGIRIINPSEFPVFDKELAKGFQIQPFNSVTALESSVKIISVNKNYGPFFDSVRHVRFPFCSAVIALFFYETKPFQAGLALAGFQHSDFEVSILVKHFTSAYKLSNRWLSFELS